MLGTVFMGLQGLASVGIITINWERTTELFGQYADLDGDGKVDKHDAEKAMKELQVCARSQSPAASQLLCLARISMFAEGSSCTQSLQARLTKDMGPAAGGFGPGFLLGLRYG